MLIFLKCVWAGLIPLGLFFIALERRCGFDRCFRYFGIAQLLLCAMTGIDLWILPTARPLSAELAWTRAMFVVGCQFAVFYFWYMAELTRWEGRRFVWGLSAYAALISILFFTDWMLHIVGGAIVRAPGFDLLFQPFMALCLFGALSLLLKRIRRTEGTERKVLRFHLAGFLMLFLFGCLDVFFTYYVPEPFFVSFNTFGSLAFGISTSLVLLERIMALLREREALSAQIRSAFEEVADSRKLRVVGESAAMVQHEVKNYASLIQANLNLISAQAEVSPETRARLRRIERSAAKLESLTRGLLDLPSALAIESAAWFPVPDLLEDLIAREFPDACIPVRRNAIDADLRVLGDASRLEQAFYNLLRNARQAGAYLISVDCIRKGQAIVVSIEDDGPGCDPGRMGILGKPFYTTKQGAGGSGLGICVSKAIVENHGGTLAFHLKNGIPGMGTGLIADIVLSCGPDGAQPRQEPPNVLIASWDADLGAKLAKTAKNLFLAPLDFGALDGPGPDWTLAVVEEGMDRSLAGLAREGSRRTVRVRPDGYARCFSPEGIEMKAGIFCESFLAGCL